jgi:hypothetical protein
MTDGDDDDDDDDGGGDAACWLDQVCDRCGAILEGDDHECRVPTSAPFRPFAADDRTSAVSGARRTTQPRGSEDRR